MGKSPAKSDVQMAVRAVGAANGKIDLIIARAIA